MFRNLKCALAAPVVILGMTVSAQASTIMAYYGDDDGFGIGATMGALNPTVSNAEIGEAPFTDYRLAGSAFPMEPSFAPTGSFDAFVVSDTILSATLTMRAGALDTNPDPLDGPGTNTIVLDGMAIPSSFFDQFTANNGTETNGENEIETESIALSAAFFPLLSDGLVSLTGTNISERQFSGSFQLDFLLLTIETADAPGIPEPGTLALFGLGLTALGFARRKGAARS